MQARRKKYAAIAKEIRTNNEATKWETPEAKENLEATIKVLSTEEPRIALLKVKQVLQSCALETKRKWRQ